MPARMSSGTRTQAARDLAPATGADEARLDAGFDNAKHPYVLVARQLTPDQQATVMHLGLPGLEFEPSAKRYYPDGRAAAQLLGVTDPDNNGVSGLELGLQDQIRAMPSGQPVATSIDMRVQYILAHETEAARETFNAKAAGGIVMDVNTGEIMAMISLPDFDPNERQLARRRFHPQHHGPGRLRAGLGVQDLLLRPGVGGSHHSSLDEVFPIGQGLKIGKYTIHEAERMPATLAARDILAQSSNIGTAQIAMRSGGVRQKAVPRQSRSAQPVQTELPETARPLYPRNWGTIETATVGFGQGISVSPLSFVAAAASVVNGGRRIPPTFIKQARRRQSRRAGDQAGNQRSRCATCCAMSSPTAPARRPTFAGYDVGGKTGSAQVPGEHGRYIPHALRTSFFAAFPIDNPRYVVFVLMDQPHGTKETGGFALAGYTAVPPAAEVISRIAPLLGVPNNAPPVTLARGNS